MKLEKLTNFLVGVGVLATTFVGGNYLATPTEQPIQIPSKPEIVIQETKGEEEKGPTVKIMDWNVTDIRQTLEEKINKKVEYTPNRLRKGNDDWSFGLAVKKKINDSKGIALEENTITVISDIKNNKLYPLISCVSPLFRMISLIDPLYLTQNSPVSLNSVLMYDFLLCSNCIFVCSNKSNLLNFEK